MGRLAPGVLPALLLSLAASAAQAQPGAREPAAPLGAPPLCEASGLQHLPGGLAWLVADNEIRDRLFRFREQNVLLEPVEPATLALPEGAKGPRDIEALALLGDELIVVGSHSRGRDCKADDKRKRQAILRVSLEGGQARARGWILSRQAVASVRGPGASVAACLQALFVAPAPQQAREVCQALVDAEQLATPAQCRALNIEGAVGLPPGIGGPPGDRLWLGLRSPLVGQRAILLRVTPTHDELRFDAVRLLDLGGRGIRALDATDDALYGIAGNVTDGVQPSQLFRTPLPADESAPSPVTIVAGDLPANAEGLGLFGERAFIVTDGQEGSAGPGGEPTCTVASQQLSIQLH